jgi:hypothetical protein
LTRRGQQEIEATARQIRNEEADEKRFSTNNKMKERSGSTYPLTNSKMRRGIEVRNGPDDETQDQCGNQPHLDLSRNSNPTSPDTSRVMAGIDRNQMTDPFICSWVIELTLIALSAGIRETR